MEMITRYSIFLSVGKAWPGLHVITVALVVLCWAGTAFAQAEPAGKVILAIGDATVVRNGVERALVRDDALHSGDLLRTRAQSNLQIRMSDGSLIALRPATEFRIDEFVYQGRQDGSERGFYSLLKGGFRTVTGLIGRGNRDNYKVNTPTATVGIRGTHYTLVHCQDDCGTDSPKGVKVASLQLSQTDAGNPGLGGGNRVTNGTYGAVMEGRISITNDARQENQFGVGDFFFVSDRKSPPQRLIAPPEFLRDRLDGRARNQQKGQEKQGETAQANVGGNNANNDNRNNNNDNKNNNAPQPGPAPQQAAGPVQGTPVLQNDFRATENKNTVGEPIVISEVSRLSGNGVYPTSTNLAFMSAEYNTASGEHNAFNSISGNVSIVSDASGISSALYGTYGYTRNNARIVDSGADAGVIAWTRWSDGTPTLYVWGSQTLTANQGFHLVVGDVSASLPAQNSVRYNLIGATQPTETRSGALGGWSVTSGTIVANFLSASLTGNLGLGLSRAGESGTFTMSFSGSAQTGFNGINATVVKTAGTTALCAASCSGHGTVMFAGPAASHAGMIYEFSTGGHSVQGAAAFKR